MSKLSQIKASAGSGKTHTLTWRYLRLLSQCVNVKKFGHNPGHLACGRDFSDSPSSFGDILAVTFTNAAVAEIRERVIGTLKKAALGITPVRGLDKDVARRCLEALLADMSQLNVRTIDSMLHQIVRISALGLKLYPDFEPVFSTADAIQPYMDAFMRDAVNGDEQNESLLRDAIAGQLEYEEVNAKEGKAATFLPGEDMLERMTPFLLDVLSPDGEMLAGDSQAREKYNEALIKRQELAQLMLEQLEEFNREFPKPKAVFNKDALVLLPAIAAGKNVSGNTLVVSELRDLLNKRTLGKLDPAEAGETYMELRKTLLLCMSLQDHMKNAAIITLAKKLADDFYAGLPGGNKMPSELIPIFARRALDFNEGVCDALCRLGSRLGHFMIDEFQDTSFSQWEGLYPLIEDALARNGSLTWVGDIKQSIFMWRKARPELFDGILTNYNLADMVERPKRKRLPYNRRSSRPIVEFNNALFGPLEEPAYAKSILQHLAGEKKEVHKEAIYKIVAAFSGSRQDLHKRSSSIGVVRVENIETAGKEKKNLFMEAFENELLQYLEKRKEDRMPFSEIMVLVRANDDATEIASFLTRNNYPVVTENSLKLKGNPIIEEIVAFLIFLDNPADDVAFQTIINGKIFGEHPSAARAEADGLDFFGINRGKQSLYAFFRCQYPDAWKDIFEPFYEQARLMTAYDAAREWFRRMAVEERFPDKSLFIRSFLEVLHKAEMHGRASIPDFLEYWLNDDSNAMANMPEGVDAIKVMTIHKSKGLQAPVVFIPLTTKAQTVDANQYKSRINKKFADLLLNVPLRKEYSPEYDEAIVRQTVELMDTLYVAFTRAARELYVFAHKKSKKATLLQVLVENAGLEFPYFVENAAAVKKKKIADHDMAKQETAKEQTVAINTKFEVGGSSQPWLSRLKIARSKLFSLADLAKRRGTFIHFCLENLYFTGNAELDARRALDFAVSHSGITVEEPEEMLDKLVWLLSQPGVEEWFENGWPEQPLVDADGNEMRMDLLLKKSWGTLVIDYKSGDFSDKNVEQMQKYLRCVEDSGQFPGVACGLLVYLDKKKFRLVSSDKVFEPVGKYPNLPWRAQDEQC